MSRSTNVLCVGVISVLLAWLWPSGRLLEVATTGVSPDGVSLYEAASSNVSVPVAALMYVSLFILARLRNRATHSARLLSLEGMFVSFGAYWVLLGIIVEALGAPFITGDSTVYLRQSVTPWEAFGGHHPSGTMWVLWLGSHLGLPVAATVTGVGALEASLLQRIPGLRGRSFLAVLVVLGTLLYPDLLILRMSLWSEPVLLLGIVAAATALTKPGKSASMFLWGMLLLFLVLCEVRHATIFLLPAFAIGIAAFLSHGRIWRLCLVTAGVGTICASAWLGLNFLRTGMLTAPSRGSFECVHFIAAYHRVPFCSTTPSIPLCSADPENAFLQQRSGVVPSFVELDRFIFNAESPLTRLALTPEAACDVWRAMRRDLMENHKKEVLELMWRRVLSQFGAWEVSERGAAISTPRLPGSVEMLDTLAARVNRDVWILWALWAIGLMVGLRSRQLFSPVVLFLVVGACGHAFGIALNNPFVGMR